MVKKKIINDKMLNLLKGLTYAALSTAGTVIVQSLQSGIEWKSAVSTGLVVGILASGKNYLKHEFGINIDFSYLKK